MNDWQLNKNAQLQILIKTFDSVNIHIDLCLLSKTKKFIL